MKKLNWLLEKKAGQIIDITTHFWDTLSQRAYPLTKGSVRVPISLEPFTLSQQEYKDLQKNLLLVISAARKLANAYFINPELRDMFSLNEAEKDLIEGSYDEPFIGIVRADFFSAHTPQLLELNADYPDGICMHDVKG
jgi:hypothetical protein